MGVDFRDWNNDGKPSLFVMPLDVKHSVFRMRHGSFSVDTYKAGIGFPSLKMSGWAMASMTSITMVLRIYSPPTRTSMTTPMTTLSNTTARQRRVPESPDATFRDVSAQAGPDMQVRAAHRGCAFGDSITTARLMWLYPPLVIMPNCFTHHNQQQPLDSASDDRRQKQPGRNWHAHQSHRRIRLVQYNHVPLRGVSLVLDKRVHFGWAVIHEIKEIELRWPSGRFSSAKTSRPINLKITRARN